MMSRRGKFVLAFVGAALICSSIALGGSAAKPSKTIKAKKPSKTIKACVSKQTGIFRVSRRCKKGEKRVVWNAAGKAGAKGVPGAPGAVGQAGAKGDKGDPG